MELINIAIDIADEKASQEIIERVKKIITESKLDPKLVRIMLEWIGKYPIEGTGLQIIIDVVKQFFIFVNTDLSDTPAGNVDNPHHKILELILKAGLSDQEEKEVMKWLAKHQHIKEKAYSFEHAITEILNLID